MIINNKEFDLGKPFIETYREGDRSITYVNSPNNTVGDLAFEWDLDGSQRKRWEERMEELKRLGTYGDLELIRLEMQHNPILDEPSRKPWESGTMYPGELSKFSEPVFLIFDVSENKKPLD